MIKLYTRSLIVLLFCIVSIVTAEAQPWTYNFGTSTGTADNLNSSSGNTSFFSGTPSGGGTYRVRIGGGGGSLVLENPLGTDTEVKLTASSTGASNKFSVYGWNLDSNLAYVKFNLRTTASGAADFLIGLGSSSASNNGYNDNNSFSNTYNHSIATLNLKYASGSLTTIQRRNSGSWVAINTVSSTHFSKDTDQLIEIYANNSAGSTTYNRSGSNSLNTQSWDLWIDGVKMSPSGGWGRSGSLSAGKINAFGFFGESSTIPNNNGTLYLDDLEYSNSLPTACTAPDETPVGFEYSTATENSIDLEWLDGDGDGRVIIMNVSDSFTAPEDGTSPAASTVYSGFGQQVVYNGTGSNSVVITGLLPNSTYYFRGYEYCTPDTVYAAGVSESVTTDIGSAIILTEQTAFGPFCNGTAHNISVGFDETGAFNENFKVQISNSSGAFSSNLNENIIGTGAASPISATIPVSISTGSGYRLRVVNADPLTVGDDNGSDIVINATPTTPATTTPAAVCEGISVNITATGSANATSYTFWNAVSGGTQIVTGISGNTLTTPNNLTPGNHSYFIQAENSSCSSLSRQEVVVTINAVPDIPSGSFIYSANPSCGPATIGYDVGYYFQTSASGTSTINPTSSSNTLNSSGTVYVRAYNGSCWSGAVASNAVTVVNPIGVTTQPVSISVAENGTGAISVVATNVDAYQWQENSGSGWSDISGATTSVLTFNNPEPNKNGYTYRVVMTATAPCANVNSSVATLTVAPPAAGKIWFNLITGTNPGQSNPYTTGQDTNVNIIVSGIGRASGINGTAANDRYNTNGWDVSNLASDKYITWTITAKSGYVLSLSTLDVKLRRSGTGPNKLQIRTSLDDFSSGTEINYTSTANDVSFSFPINAIDEPEIEVRLYGYGATGAGGTLSVNEFEFLGIVKRKPLSEDCSAPYSLSTNVVGGQVTFNWIGTEGTDIYALLLIDVTTGNYSKGFSPTTSGFTATIPSGTYRWVISSLCSTATMITDNSSQWISGKQFTVP